MKKRSAFLIVLFIVALAVSVLGLSSCFVLGDDGPRIEVIKQGVVYKYSMNESYYASYIKDNVEADIVIPSEIDGLPVTEIQSDLFRNCIKIKSVQIPSSIKTMGENVFANCYHLKTVTFAQDINLTAIPYGTFYNCG